MKLDSKEIPVSVINATNNLQISNNSEGKQQDVQQLIHSLFSSDSSSDCYQIGKDIANLVFINFLLLEKFNIIEQFTTACKDKKNGFNREGGALGIAALALITKKQTLPLLLSKIDTLTELLSDKGLAVKEAALLAMENIISAIDSHSIAYSLPFILNATNSCKWAGRLVLLDCVGKIAQKYPLEMGMDLPVLIPAITNCMHDTKLEVSKAAGQCMTSLCKVVGNPDLEPHIDLLIDCMAHPDHVNTAVQKISATTFVAEVTGPALALIVPLLVRALNDRSAAVMRPSTVIADNLFKLVRNPPDAGQFLDQLLPGLDRIIETAAFPEIRELAQNARTTLVHAAGADSSAPQKFAFTLDDIRLVSGLGNINKANAAPFVDIFLGVVENLLQREEFRPAVWKTVLSDYLTPIMGKKSEQVVAKVNAHFHQEYRACQVYGDIDDDDEEGELLCDVEFSLAYGGMMLLNNTRLRLRRGMRYGLCGPNGAGKSTLMRSISLGKVDGFPTADELKCVFVQHTLQGDEGELSVVDFLALDPGLKAKGKEIIIEILAEVGFDEERQVQPVGALSGGWKMKLELARAMLLEADILLLDEPTNHLDVANVAWLENYLLTHTNITSLIVSHDSTFLDNVCTCIAHYESKKLVYYKGNLAKFVERKPEAKVYYTLSDSVVKFSFPPPSVLLGIRSNTKAIMKMSHCTFTYPGAPKASMKDVSVQLSLSSRVGVVGPNGAGKSTMIKLLTGELIPQEGTVWKHPNIRVGYVAQHAFHHLELHLEKTPNQYIQWRYQGGQDREVLEKASRRLTDEDRQQLEVEITFEGIRGKIEVLLGRQKLKKSYQYEVKWVGLPHKHNKWIPRDLLLDTGFQKIVQAFDDSEASREGQGYRELVPSVIRAHIEQVGLPGDIADNNMISGLSGGQKVKVVLAAAMWNNPHMLVLDEPTNYLDREALGGLAVAIREWGGAVIMISHNTEFVSALCPELWEIEAGTLKRKGHVEIADDNFEDQAEKIAKSVSKSSGKKKKLSRNELKAREVRRRTRHLKWLSEGGEKEKDTDDEED